MKLDKKTSWRRRTKRSEAMKHVPEKTLAAQRDSLFEVQIFWVSSTTGMLLYLLRI